MDKELKPKGPARRVHPTLEDEAAITRMHADLSDPMFSTVETPTHEQLMGVTHAIGMGFADEISKALDEHAMMLEVMAKHRPTKAHAIEVEHFKVLAKRIACITDDMVACLEMLND